MANRTEAEIAAAKAAILAHLEDGQGERKACTAANIPFGTYESWKRKQLEFKAAVNMAKEARNAFVEDSLYAKALKGSEHACEIWLYNRDPERWQNISKIEVWHSGKVEITGLGDLKTLTDEQLVKLAGQLTVIGQASDDDSDTGTGTGTDAR